MAISTWKRQADVVLTFENIISLPGGNVLFPPSIFGCLPGVSGADSSDCSLGMLSAGLTFL